MPASYSIDLRLRVIDAYQAKEGSQRKLADRFKVSLSFVQRLIRHYQNTGLVSAKPHGGGAKAKITRENLPRVQQLVDEQPDAILEELCEQWATLSGISVSLPTMHRAVRRLGLTTKKKLCMPVSKIVCESNRGALSIETGFWALTPTIWYLWMSRG